MSRTFLSRYSFAGQTCSINCRTSLTPRVPSGGAVVEVAVAVISLENKADCNTFWPCASIVLSNVMRHGSIFCRPMDYPRDRFNRFIFCWPKFLPLWSKTGVQSQGLILLNPIYFMADVFPPENSASIIQNPLKAVLFRRSPSPALIHLPLHGFPDGRTHL